MVYIEFIGLPGAGKTTIREQLVKQIQNSGNTKCLTLEEAYLYASRIKIDRIFRLMLCSLPDKIAIKLSNKLMNRSLMQFEAQNRFLAKNGKALDAFISSDTFNIMSINDRQLVISSFLQVGACYECIYDQFSDDTAIFFEEGFMQKSFMFISHLEKQSQHLANLYLYLEHCPMPNIILYIKADLNTCFERMMSRPKGLTERLKKADENSIMDFLKSSDNHLKNVTIWLRENQQDIHVIDVDNELNINDVLMDLNKEIAKFV